MKASPKNFEIMFLKICQQWKNGQMKHSEDEAIHKKDDERTDEEEERSVNESIIATI